MESKVQRINRRTFLRLAAYVLPALTALRQTVEGSQAMPLSEPYGAGSYGAGRYAGYAVYLPAISAEGA